MAQFDHNPPAPPCECNDYEMCGPCTAQLQARMEALRAMEKPPSDSLSDVTEWFLAHNTETPMERFEREAEMFKRFRSGEHICGCGTRISVALSPLEPSGGLKHPF